ncbi:hypothetical protein D3C80_1266930 [compost metagenome]
MIAGAAEREGQTHARHRRQGDLEQGGVFSSEMAIQEGGVLIPLVQAADAQRSLQADQVVVLGRETGRRFLQLQGIRVVLGVIDGQEFALGYGQSVIERTRLGGRGARRNDKDMQPFRPFQRQGSVDGGLIVGFKRQVAVQQVMGVVQPRQALDQVWQDRGFVVKGDNDGIARPTGGRRRCGSGALADDNGQQPPTHDDQKAQLNAEQQGVADSRRRQHRRCSGAN